MQCFNSVLMAIFHTDLDWLVVSEESFGDYWSCITNHMLLRMPNKLCQSWKALKRSINKPKLQS